MGKCSDQPQVLREYSAEQQAWARAVLTGARVTGNNPPAWVYRIVGQTPPDRAHDLPFGQF